MGEAFWKLFLTLRTQSVRDLAWAVGSPGLLAGDAREFSGRLLDDSWCQAALEHGSDFLKNLDLQPAILHAWLEARPTRRLGRYFEALMEFWFTHRAGLRLVASHVPVRHGKITLGEYDALCLDEKTQDLVHLELAVKYYLYTEFGAKVGTDPWQCYLGPQTHDRLDLKVGRMFAHQLSLSNTVLGHAALPISVRHLPLQALAFLKGTLFYPWIKESGFANNCVNTCAMNNFLDPLGQSRISRRALRGFWIHVQHASDMVTHVPEATRWMILPKMRWLSPAVWSEEHRTQASELSEGIGFVSLLEEHFATDQNPLLVARLEPVRNSFSDSRVNELELGQSELWCETGRGFVVPTGWPEIAPVETLIDTSSDGSIEDLKKGPHSLHSRKN